MIRRISIAELFGDPAFPGLVEEYAAECSIHLIGKVCPQQPIYEAIERAGSLQCFGAYRGNALIGLAIVFITVLPHYGLKTATMDSVFVAKEHRMGGIGIRLLKAVDEFAKEAACVAILYSAPSGGQLEKYLSRKCERTNAIFCKRLI